MKSKSTALFLFHAVIVCSAGIVPAYFVQVQKDVRAVDYIWSLRLFFLAISLGAFAWLSWYLFSLLYAELRRKELGAVLQADAYSYVAFYLLLGYRYIQRDFGMTAFLLAVLAYYLLLKLVFLLLMESRKIPPVLAFSVSEKGRWKPLILLAVVFPSFYFHQTSLASYTASEQKKWRLKIEKEARKGIALPWGHSVSFELDTAGKTTLCVPYGFAESMITARGNLTPPKNLLVTIRKKDKNNKVKVPLSYNAGWHDLRIHLSDKEVGSGPVTVTVGTKKSISWLWSNPAATTIAFADAFAVSERRQEPNIILISVDALRPDHLSAFGYDRVATPALDSLVRDAVSFPLAVAPGTWTKPSNISMMTSVYPERNVIDVEFARFPYRTLTEELADRNYVTIAVSDAGWVSSETAFMNGFNIFSETLCSFMSCKAEINFEMARQHIEDWKAYPFFMWIYSDEVHNPTWHPVPEWGECGKNQDGMIAAYDSSLESFDLALGKFLSYLKESGLYDNSIILLTADHGNAFGEEHENSNYISCGHGGMPYNEQILIPLIIKPHTGLNAPAGRIVRDYVSGIDIAPTLLDLAQLPAAKGFEGISLLPAMFGGPLPEGREIYASQGLHGPYSLSMIKGSMKILYPVNSFPDRIRIYDLLHDPHERVDLSERTALKEEMAALVETYLAEGREVTAQFEKTRIIPFSKELSQQLRALGYIQ